MKIENKKLRQISADYTRVKRVFGPEQWSEIEPLYSGMRNRKWSKRELTNAVLYIVKTGCQWRQLPQLLNQ